MEANSGTTDVGVLVFLTTFLLPPLSPLSMLVDRLTSHSLSQHHDVTAVLPRIVADPSSFTPHLVFDVVPFDTVERTTTLVTEVFLLLRVGMVDAPLMW